MRSDQIEIVTIGTELLLGFTVDTNAAFLGQRLADAGVEIVRRSTVGDTPSAIRAAIDEALARTGAVLTTGGLGPTRDDMSKTIVADLLDLPLEFRDDVWEMVLARYRRFGRAPVESNRSQAMVPAGGTWLPNHWGTAPGLWLETPRGLVIMLPGVPLEMRMLTEHEVVPRLQGRRLGTVIRSRTIRTCGVPESTLAERIGDAEDAIAPLSLAYLPSTSGVDLRITAWHLAAGEADERLEAATVALRACCGDSVYGTGNDDLAAVVLEQLRRSRRRLVVAESCTGGLLGARITAIAGSSDVFVGGIVAYDNYVKRDLLNVSSDTLDAHGAVSAETAVAMAMGAALRLGAEVAVSVTGIAGPSGGTEEKPVGTVWSGWSVDGVTQTSRSVFGGTRQEIRERAAQGALMGLWRRLGAT